LWPFKFPIFITVSWWLSSKDIKGLKQLASHFLFSYNRNYIANPVGLLKFPPAWSCPQVLYLVLFAWVFSRMMLCRRCLIFLYKRLLSKENLWNLKVISKHKNHFDTSFKANLFWKNQAILVDRVSWMLGFFIFFS